MKKIVATVFLCLMVLVPAAHAKVLAKVDDLEITERDVDERLAQLPPQYKTALSNEAGRKRLTEQLVQEKLIYLKAKQEDYATNADVLERLEKVKPGIMISQFLTDTLAEIKPLEKELKAYYQAHAEEFKQEEQVWAKHILCETEPEAEAARARVLKGEDFEAVAKEVSKGPSSEKGGDLGWFAKDAMVKPFADAAFGLEEGAVSGPVKTQFGHHIIKCYGKKSAGTKPFEDVRAGILQTMRQKKHQEYVDELIQGLKEKHSVTLY